MIAIIRIVGIIKINKDIKETLDRLTIKRKFACTLFDEKNEIKMGMLKKVKNFVAFGDLEKNTLIRLLEKRGQLIDKTKKIDAEKMANELLNGRKPSEIGLKPFFRLHPPRGGLKSSKKQFPRGILGNHGKEINKLIEKML